MSTYYRKDLVKAFVNKFSWLILILCSTFGVVEKSKVCAVVLDSICATVDITANDFYCSSCNLLLK